MRRNDFFKYLLFSGGNPASRSELEMETLPYTFNSNSYKLRNYRIYGNTVNGESVGDVVTEGDHTGEYCVPVTVEGKNLFDITKITENKYVYNDNFKNAASSDISEYIAISNELTYTLSWNASTLLSPNLRQIGIYDSQKQHLGNIPYTVNNRFSTSFTVNIMDAAYMIVTIDKGFQNIMLNYGSTALPYEPYHAPVTTNLYLPEQIKMVGDEAEYVDYKEQKQYFADGTSADVVLPVLLTFPGTNMLSAGTTVQPSKVYLQGKISEAEIVSAEPVQTNVQSLQPLSLDDDDLQLDVMPSNDLQLDVIIPTANLNRIEDDEDAE